MVKKVKGGRESNKGKLCEFFLLVEKALSERRYCVDCPDNGICKFQREYETEFCFRKHREEE